MTSIKIRRIFCFLLPIGGFIPMPPLSIPVVHDAFADVVPMPGPDDYPEQGDPDEAPEPGNPDEVPMPGPDDYPEPGDPDEAPEPFPDDTPQP